MGLELAKAWDRYPELGPYNFVIPVPLFREKEKERGFNQSRLLAEVLCREKRLFLLEGAAGRIKNTPSQTGLTKKEQMDKLDEKDFVRVKEKLEALLELSYNHQSRSSGSVGNPKSNISIDKPKK